jgi:hypothetical protein
MLNQFWIIEYTITSDRAPRTTFQYRAWACNIQDAMLQWNQWIHAQQFRDFHHISAVRPARTSLERIPL